MSVRFELQITKANVRTQGPDDAECVLTAPHTIVAANDFDATVEFMRGKLKATGHTGVILEALRSGRAQQAFRLLADEE